jgi:hypothetical protein
MGEIITSYQLDQIVAEQKAKGIKIYCSYCRLLRGKSIEVDNPMNHDISHFGWWYRNVVVKIPWRIKYIYYSLKELRYGNAMFWLMRKDLSVLEGAK